MLIPSIAAQEVNSTKTKLYHEIGFGMQTLGNIHAVSLFQDNADSYNYRLLPSFDLAIGYGWIGLKWKYFCFNTESTTGINESGAMNQIMLEVREAWDLGKKLELEGILDVGLLLSYNTYNWANTDMNVYRYGGAATVGLGLNYKFSAHHSVGLRCNLLDMGVYTNKNYSVPTGTVANNGNGWAGYSIMLIYKGSK